MSIVLPAYEEADNLDFLIPELHKAARVLTQSYEILVVDAQEPRDRTPEICKKHGVRHVHRIGGALYGHAIRTALQEARGRYIIMMDADGSHGPSFIASLWQSREKADMVIASRYVKGGNTENPAILILMSLTVNIVFRWVLGLKCSDVSNSFRLYKGDDLRKLSLRCNNFDIVEEILVKLIFGQKNYAILELPFVFAKRKAGKTKRSLVLFALGYISTLLRLRKFKNEAKKNSR